jgi:hypothetical protein
MRKLILAMAVLIVVALNVRAAVPANDRFSNRIILTGTNVTVTGSNVGATKEGGEPDHAGNAGGSSVWWAWTAPTNGELRLTTDGSVVITATETNELDTLLAVYTGPRVNALTVVATNDDHGAAGTYTSRVRFPVVSATEYLIAVDGFNDGTTVETENITLALEFVRNPFNRPDNDNFTNRLTLQGSSVSTNRSNVQATREPAEPLHAEQFGDTSVWFTWTAPTKGTVRFSTEGSSFDTLLGVYSGSALSNLTEVASSDDIDPLAGILTSAVTIDVEAGQVFQIAVDGFDGEAGQISLRIETILTRLISPKRLANGQFQFTLTGPAERDYDVQASGNPANPDLWSRLSLVFNTNGTLVITDPVASSLPRRFYRALLLPP